MPDIEFGQSSDRRYRPDVVGGQPVSGVDFEAKRGRVCSGRLQPFEFTRPAMRIRPGVQLDDGCPQARRCVELAHVGRDEQTDADPRIAQPRDERREAVVLPRRVEAALGRALLATFGNDANRRRPVRQRDAEHFGRRRHLEVERQPSRIDQPRDIVVGDVPPILAQVRGNAVRTRRRRHLRRTYGIGMRPTARVADGCDVIDVDA